MALTAAQKQQAYRNRKARQDEVIAAAKSFVPTPGVRQNRAVDHALWHLDGWERGEIAYPPPGALSEWQASRPGLLVGSGKPNWVREVK